MIKRIFIILLAVIIIFTALTSFVIIVSAAPAVQYGQQLFYWVTTGGAKQALGLLDKIPAASPQQAGEFIAFATALITDVLSKYNEWYHRGATEDLDLGFIYYLPVPPTGTGSGLIFKEDYPFKNDEEREAAKAIYNYLALAKEYSNNMLGGYQLDVAGQSITLSYGQFLDVSDMAAELSLNLNFAFLGETLIAGALKRIPEGWVYGNKFSTIKIDDELYRTKAIEEISLGFLHDIAGASFTYTGLYAVRAVPYFMHEDELYVASGVNTINGILNRKGSSFGMQINKSITYGVNHVAGEKHETLSQKYVNLGTITVGHYRFFDFKTNVNSVNGYSYFLKHSFVTYNSEGNCFYTALKNSMFINIATPVVNSEIRTIEIYFPEQYYEVSTGKFLYWHEVTANPDIRMMFIDPAFEEVITKPGQKAKEEKGEIFIPKPEFEKDVQNAIDEGLVSDNPEIVIGENGEVKTVDGIKPEDLANPADVTVPTTPTNPTVPEVLTPFDITPPDITEIFPFSIPWDVGRIVELLIEDPEPPIVKIPVKVGDRQEVIVIDPTIIRVGGEDIVRELTNYGSVLLFLVALIRASYKMIDAGKFI